MSTQRSTERIGYLVDRETQAIRSVLRLVPKERRASVEKSLSNLLDIPGRLAREQTIPALKSAADRRASALGLARPVRTVAPTAGPQTEAAARIVVKRKRLGPIPMDDLPVEQWEGYPYSSWALVPVTALYWCDGSRNLAEVVRLTSLEHDTTGFDFVGYFRFLAKHGYVELRER